ncbi:MAG: siderophore-interacting protein [Pseudomonadota bacterium]
MEKKRPAPRRVQVIRKKKVSPHMLRITLGGDELADFPTERESGYIKLRVGEPTPNSDDQPVVRTYTVRHFDSAAKELDVDFVLHDVSGPAADWARGCAAGDTIQFGGPGPTKLVDFTADWFLLVGDMSALPAIGANIERLPRDARGTALIEIIHPDDRQDIEIPEALNVQWIVNPHPDVENSVLLDAVKALPWLPGRPSIWVAGEFSQSLAIRKFLKAERQFERNQMYASSYWQIGMTEDGHRVSKAQVTD